MDVQGRKKRKAMCALHLHKGCILLGRPLLCKLHSQHPVQHIHQEDDLGRGPNQGHGKEEIGIPTAPVDPQMPKGEGQGQGMEEKGGNEEGVPHIYHPSDEMV